MNMESLEEYLAGKGIVGEIKLLRGMRLISEFFHSVKEKFLLVQDDYTVWHHHDEIANYGKPLIVGKGTSKQVFFDDHCKPDEDCILDVWDVEHGV